MNLILKTINGIKNTQVPIWLMRQAGRYLPEYRKIRENFPSFIDFCLTPEAASEVTIQPLKRFNLDAAIIFSDILILPHALGLKVDFQEGKGPILDKIERTKDLKLNKKALQKVYKAIDITRAILEKDFPEKALIGFAGAPWTVACYMIEGKGSKDFLDARKFCYTNKKDFEDIIELLIEKTSEHLIGQINAGVKIVKIFDSWAGILPPELFEKFVIEPTKKIVDNIRSEYKDIPIIGFAKGSGSMNLDYAKKTGISCVAVDHNTKISWMKENLDEKIILQGNLDNVLLFSDKNDIEMEAKKILDTLSDRPFIFNLGHGVLPGTPIENVEHLVNVVKNYEKCIKTKKIK